MATLEKVIVKIYPISDKHISYEVTFEHIAPHFVAGKLQQDVFNLLHDKYVKEGVENIKAL